MAQLPDNIVSIMMVDNAGAVVSVPVSQLFAQQASVAPTQSAAETTPASENTTTVVNNTVETKTALEILADIGYITIPNEDKSNLINSIIYQSVSKKIGFNNKSPKYIIDAKSDSININQSKREDGYRINGLLAVYADTETKVISVGDSKYLDTVNVHKLIISGLIPTTALGYTRVLTINDSGAVSVLAPFTSGSVIFSNGQTFDQDNANFFFDNTNNRLGIGTNSPAYTGDFNGTVRASTSLITPVIGNSSGITANNTWTYTSNVNVPLLPTASAHAASKKYVDDTALTGLKLGASVKTVSTTNITLSGLSAVNGYTPIAGDRILVIGQTTQSENGVYDADSSGWTRSTDSDSDTELRGYQYLITNGTNANFRYGNTNQSTITVGSTAITYQTISAGESDPVFTASPSFGITTTNINNWNTAYNRSATSLGFSGTTLTLTKQDGSSLTATISFTTSAVSEGTNLYYTDVRSRAALSAGSGISYNNSTGVITSSITQYTDASARSAISAGTGISYSSATGVISSSVTQYTDALARAALSAGTGISYNNSTGVISSTYSVPTLAAVCAAGADATGYSITANAYFEASDVRYKNILGENPDIDVSGIDAIKYMRTTYDKDKIRYGYSAQQVFDILPELVNNDGVSLSVNYTDLHTLKILQLEKRVAELESKLGI
jgi:hypothetical protein